MLFGHQNDDTAQSAGTPPPPPTPASLDDAVSQTAPAVNPLAVDSETGVGLPTTQEDMASPAPAESTSAPEVAQESPAIFETTPNTESATPTLDEAPANPPAAATDASQDDLLAMKQQALTQLSPLVSQLDQSPEEKFRTTMMLLQSTDNQALIRDAYTAAQAIPDEKARAQALLDVVNEINYFTQQK